MLPFNIKIDYEKSHGSYVYDLNTQRESLDMVNHYSSLPLGYNHPVFKSKEFQEDILRVAGVKTAMGIYNSQEREDFVKEFKEFACPTGFTHLHFACTGSLAIEAAVKTAWAYSAKKTNRTPEMVSAFIGSFHGINSFGNFLSTTDRVNKGFIVIDSEYPFDHIIKLGGIPLDFLDKLKNFDEPALMRVLSNLSGGIIVEPIQCTSGDKSMDISMLKELRRLCTLADIPLIFDEIQTGFCTTGKTWYCEHLGIQPDIIVFGKKAQVSGIMVKDEFAAIFKDYDKLSVTFDGDLIDMIRCRYIMKAIKDMNEEPPLVWLKEAFYGIKHIRNVRGIGGLIAFDFDTTQERDEFVKKAFENGLLCNPTAEKSVRLRPNLACTMEEASHCIKIIKETIFQLYL